jgi:predicted nucleic acid-binding protein
MYLLDTNVISELQKRRSDPHVVTWIKSIAPSDLFLSTVTITEIEFCIARRQRHDPMFAQRLTEWLELTLRVYGERILPLTIGVARRWGRLSAQRGNKQLDLAIAATALEHGLTVVTRNVSDFQPTGVAILNPFDPRAIRNP